MTIKHEPIAISLPMDIYDELRRKASLYDEIVNIKSYKQCPEMQKTFEATLNVVCSSYDVSRVGVLSSSRLTQYVDARKIVMYCLSELGFIQKDISDFMKRNDRTTVSHHVHDVQFKMLSYPKYHREVTHIFNKIKLAIHELR